MNFKNCLNANCFKCDSSIKIPIQQYNDKNKKMETLKHQFDCQCGMSTNRFGTLYFYLSEEYDICIQTKLKKFSVIRYFGIPFKNQSEFILNLDFIPDWFYSPKNKLIKKINQLLTFS